MDVGRAPDQMPSPELARLPNVIATPHIGGLTPPASESQAFDTVRQVEALVEGKVPPGAVNAQHGTAALRRGGLILPPTDCIVAGSGGDRAMREPKDLFAVDVHTDDVGDYNVTEPGWYAVDDSDARPCWARSTASPCATGRSANGAGCARKVRRSPK